MEYKVYILYSKKLDRYYKGFTKNLEKRLEKHNNGGSTYTSSGMPWKLITFIDKETRKEAMALERKLKNLNRKRLEDFIQKFRISDGHD